MLVVERTASDDPETFQHARIKIGAEDFRRFRLRKQLAGIGDSGYGGRLYICRGTALLWRRLVV